MLRIISSRYKYSQYYGYDEHYNVRPGQFGSEDEALEHEYEHAIGLWVKGELDGVEVDGGEDKYFDESEAVGIAESVAAEFFPTGEMDHVWVEDDEGYKVWEKWSPEKEMMSPEPAPMPSPTGY